MFLLLSLDSNPLPPGCGERGAEHDTPDLVAVLRGDISTAESRGTHEPLATTRIRRIRSRSRDPEEVRYATAGVTRSARRRNVQEQRPRGGGCSSHCRCITRAELLSRTELHRS